MRTVSTPDLILGIETSCDETSASVVALGREIRSNIISSQIPIHQKFGGVVPEIASRHHLELVNAVIQAALDEAETTIDDLDAIAVTCGPGLVGALLVGVSTAKAMAYAKGKALLGVNHMEGHVYANFLANPDLELPAICLVVSGGHTDLILIKAHGDFTILGRTRDDAAGEAFDKVARTLGLGYPGGPAIDRLAKEGDEQAFALPRATLEGSLDFSFSGLKSAVLNTVNQRQMKNETICVADLAASFQWAVVDILVEKTMAAVRATGARQVLLAGGVAANSRLRSELTQRCTAAGLSFSAPPLILCTDNAAMIACVGHYMLQRGQVAGLDLNAYPNLKLGEKAY
ncbi:MAG: tRNA (adenosine(37)-N6)-threonylcarbamoyltransferase complex transferase subunit TsaD [Bacillota bacterium]